MKLRDHFEALAPQPQQAFAARAANAPTIPIHGRALGGLPAPVPSSAIGLREIGAYPDRLEIDQRSVVREIDRVDPLPVTFTTGC